MDYVDGKTLEQELADHGPLRLDRLLRMFLQITDGLAHAHANQVLHRDLKPSNIMLVRNDKGQEEVRIMDFGIAKLLSTEYSAQQLTKTGEPMGSPPYMSPEQARSSNVDQRSDLYSLGCVMYEAATGTPPFVGKSALETLMKHVDESPVPMVQASLGSDIDQGLQDIVSRLLKKNPAARYQSVAQLEADLTKLQEATVGGKMARFIYANRAPERGNSKRWKLSVAGGVVVLLVLSAIIWSIVSNRPTTPPLPPDYPTSIFSDIDLTQSKRLIKDAVAHGGRAINIKRIVQSFGVMITVSDDDLAPLADAKNAEEIDLPAKQHLTDAGLQYLKNLKLRRLVIDETDVRTLSALKNMTSLVRLSAARTAVDKNGLAVIAGLHNLDWLNLSNTSIEDSDLMQLKSLHKLRRIDLNECTHLSKPAVKTLESSLPQCVFLTSTENTFTLGGTELTRAAELKLQGKWAEADQQYTKILSRLYKANPPNVQAIVFYLQNRIGCQEALQHYRTVIDLVNKEVAGLRTLPDSTPEIVAILPIQASSYEALANAAPKAPDRELLNQAIKIREQVSDSWGTSHDTDNSVENQRSLASDYLLTGQRAQAVALFENLLPKYKQLKIEHSVQAAAAMQTLGDIYLIGGDYQKALDCYAPAEQICRITPALNDNGQVVTLNRAKCELSLGHLDKAEAVLKVGLTLPCSNLPIRAEQYRLMLDLLAVQKIPPQDERMKQYTAALADVQKHKRAKKP